MDRPEWVHCVEHSHVSLKGMSWCGRDVRHEWAFNDAAHAAEHGRKKGRMADCRECANAIGLALRNGHDDPEYG